MKTCLFLILTLALACAATLPLHGADETPAAEAPVKFDKASYKVGDIMTLTYTFTNTTSSAVEVTELDLDKQSLSFRITVNDEGGTWTRIHNSCYDIKSYPKVKVQPGQSISKEFKVPALMAGKWTVLASYNTGADKLKSEPVTVEVAAGDNGETVAVVKLETSLGDMLIEIDPQVTTGTSINFASAVAEGFYTDLTFHRVIKDFMIQGGCPEGTGGGGPGYSIPFEETKRSHTKGAISMARSKEKDSGGSQFFICHASPSHLNGGYCAFGQLVEGEDTLDAIAETQCQMGGDGAQSSPVEPVVIKKASIVAYKK